MSKFSTRQVAVTPNFHLRQVSLYFITVQPDDGCNKNIKYVAGTVTKKEVIYSYTCLKTKSGHNQNVSPAKNFYSPKDSEY